MFVRAADLQTNVSCQLKGHLEIRHAPRGENATLSYMHSLQTRPNVGRSVSAEVQLAGAYMRLFGCDTQLEQYSISFRRRFT